MRCGRRSFIPRYELLREGEDRHRSYRPQCSTLEAREGYKDAYPVLGYPRILGQAWSNHAAPRRQHVVC